MIKKIELCTLFLLIAYGIFSQGIVNPRKRLFYRGDRENSIAFSGYFGLQKTIDEGVSPLLYQGIYRGFGFGYQSLRMPNMWNISAAFCNSSQYSSAQNDKGYYQSNNYDINFRYLWNINKKNRLPLSVFIGIYSQSTIRIRINENMFNAALGYDIMLGLGGSIKLSKSLNIKMFDINLWKWYVHYKSHKITFEYGLDLPINNIQIRPSYVATENFVSNNQSPINLERAKSSSLSEMFFIQSDLGFIYHLYTNNEISFKYIWQYYQITPEYSHVKGAINIIQISFRLKLNTFNNETL